MNVHRALFLLLLLASPALSAQETNAFTNDPKAVVAGESQFRSNCAFCHGLGARGGGRGSSPGARLDLSRDSKLWSKLKWPDRTVQR
jgi:mono/diheme cytochrome c family protein